MLTLFRYAPTVLQVEMSDDKLLIRVFSLRLKLLQEGRLCRRITRINKFVTPETTPKTDCWIMRSIFNWHYPLEAAAKGISQQCSHPVTCVMRDTVSPGVVRYHIRWSCCTRSCELHTHCICFARSFFSRNCWVMSFTCYWS